MTAYSFVHFNLHRLSSILLLFLLHASYTNAATSPTQPQPAPSSSSHLALIPEPQKIAHGSGSWVLPPVLVTSVAGEATWTQHIKVLDAAIQSLTAGQHRLEFSSDPDQPVRLQFATAPELGSEAYRLNVDASGIQIIASTLKGLSRATATLLQLIGSSEFPSSNLGIPKPRSIPHLSLGDEPTVEYRNLMIDMGRNPHSIELLKETIDLLWFYKVDSLQLHLTDDQRFAFPSTHFPKLWDGLITKEQFEELEKYAYLRGVTIIPELEVPGHSGKLRAIYPEVFGKSPTDLASSDSALVGIKRLLDEMMEVFSSSPYIHIGGDEAYGVPEELQRDLINQLDEYVRSKGRETLVWEGPRPGTGDNRVNREVIHINWRTINYRPDQMLDDGYRVINAAWDPLYIVDHYPRINFTMTSPQHIYETLSLERFKHVNPGIPTFAAPVETAPNDNIIGLCMTWWEGREENFFPQVTPRLIPFADISWAPERERDYNDFEQRVTQTELVRKKSFFPVQISTSDLVIPGDGVFHENCSVSLTPRSSSQDASEIHYTLDGSPPNANSPLYEMPISVDETCILRARLFSDGQPRGHASRIRLTAVNPIENLALGKPVSSSATSGVPFSVERITDGSIQNLEFYLGYPATPDPIELTIDLEVPTRLERIVVHSYSISGSYEQYLVELSSDGKAFSQVAQRMEKPESPSLPQEHSFEPQTARYIRIRSYGNKGYVFDSFSKIVEVQAF